MWHASLRDDTLKMPDKRYMGLDLGTVTLSPQIQAKVHKQKTRSFKLHVQS